MLVPVVGLAAFALVTPITIALLVVLAFLILSYRQTIKAYPSAGGAYIVTRDNFGLMPAQVAGVALLTDYILTVAVSVAAGSDALASAIPAAGARTSSGSRSGSWCSSRSATCAARRSPGKLFAVPTYFFVANMAVLLAVGVWRARRRRAAEGRDRPRRAWRRSAQHRGTGLLHGRIGVHRAQGVRLRRRGRDRCRGDLATACPRSGRRHGRTPGRRSWSWAPLLGVMFLGLSMLAVATCTQCRTTAAPRP